MIKMRKEFILFLVVLLFAMLFISCVDTNTTEPFIGNGNKEITVDKAGIDSSEFKNKIQDYLLNKTKSIGDPVPFVLPEKTSLKVTLVSVNCAGMNTLCVEGALNYIFGGEVHEYLGSSWEIGPFQQGDILYFYIENTYPLYDRIYKVIINEILDSTGNVIYWMLYFEDFFDDDYNDIIVRVEKSKKYFDLTSDVYTVYPYKTDGNRIANISVNVKNAYGLPSVGEKIKLETKSVAYSGGHNHHSDSRPVGSFATSLITTTTEGIATTTWKASVLFEIK